MACYIQICSPSSWKTRCPFPWWGHDMDTLSPWLASCAENPPITRRFPSQRASNTDHWRCLFCWQEQASTNGRVDGDLMGPSDLSFSGTCSVAFSKRAESCEFYHRSGHEQIWTNCWFICVCLYHEDCVNKMHTTLSCFISDYQSESFHGWFTKCITWR